MVGTSGYQSRNSFRMGLPKPNRYQPSAGFRKASSLNGRAWSESPKSIKYSLKNNSNYVLKPKLSELKKKDALYNQRAFVLRMTGPKSANKVAGALTNTSVNKLEKPLDTTVGFKSFSPWDSRFPKFFESFSPFDSRFAEFASLKVGLSFSPFHSSFPNYPYKKKSTDLSKGFQSFSPFDSRFPKHVESYSPFNSKFPTGGTANPYPTFSPFDERFPTYIYTKRHLAKASSFKKSSSLQATISLNKQLANKKIITATATSIMSSFSTKTVVSAPKPTTVATVARKQISKKPETKVGRAKAPQIATTTASFGRASYLTVTTRSATATPKASTVENKLFSRVSGTQTVTKSMKAASTVTAVVSVTKTTSAQTTSFSARPQLSLTSSSAFIPSAPPAQAMVASPTAYVQQPKTSVRLSPTNSRGIFLPTTTATPLADAFPRFTPMARTAQINSYYRPQMASMGRGQPSPLSSVLQNGGAYYANARFGAMM